MPSTLGDTVAAEVRAELGRRRMSLRDLADEMGVPSHHVWRRLSGETPLTLNDLEAITKALDLPVTHFLPAPEPAS